jgi:hypothetical protein
VTKKSDYADVFGMPVYAGWIPPEERNTDQAKLHKLVLDETPTVSEAWQGPEPKGAADRPRIWQIIKQAGEKGLIPADYLRNGQLKNLDQKIGSCVGAGAGNMLLYATCIDSLIRKQPERIVVPFWPYHYGRGRLAAGIRGPGSGSFGSAQSKALETDGWLAYDSAEVPQPTFGQTIGYTAGQETQWSDGAKIGTKFIAEGSKHPVKSARVTSTDEAAMLADSLHSFTIASSWGGRMQCPVTDGVLLNSRSGTWNHQMSVLDYIKHPRLGRLWYVLNQWRYPHGKDPGGEWDGGTGAPEGGFYIKDADLEWIINKRETFAFSDPAGFQDLNRKIDYTEIFG